MRRGGIIILVLLVLWLNSSFSFRYYDPRLIYVFDPLCGWCYGFNSELQKVIEEFRGQLRPEVYCGGLSIGEKVQPIGEKYEYIKQALPFVERKTNVLFGDAFRNNILEGRTYLYNSEPPSIALLVIRELNPAISMEYAHKIQDAFFHDGKSLNDTLTYLELNKDFGIEDSTFMKGFRNRSYFRKRMLDEFTTIEAWGVQGFPTVLIESEEGNRRIISTGYVDSETIIKRIREQLHR